MDCSLPGSSVHGIFSGKDTGMGCHFLLPGSSGLRDQTRVSWVSWTGRWILYHCADTWEAQINYTSIKLKKKKNSCLWYRTLTTRKHITRLLPFTSIYRPTYGRPCLLPWPPPPSIPSINLITEESALDATMTSSSDTRRYSLNSQLVTASGAWIPSHRCLQFPTHRLAVIIILIVMMMLMTLFSLNLKHKRATVTASGTEPSFSFWKHF